MWRTWARFASVTRSHSHGLSRCGRPNTSRKYDWNDSSGNMSARRGAWVSSGRPLNFVGLFVTWATASKITSALRRRG